MKTTRPRGLDLRRARALLTKAKPHTTVAARVEAISAELLGCPYEAHGLVGSAETPELFVAKLDRFDCVTYVETVLALARAADPEGFAEELRQVRYDGGVVAWESRNHYMTDWARRSSKRRATWPVAAEGLGVKKERLLDAVPGLPPRKTSFWCVPKSKLKSFAPRLKNGDVLLFASTKAGIDVFHCGLLVEAAGTLKLRHASRSAGSVVEQDLAAFLRANRMAGLVALRPQELA
jgi:hypothetical protein